MLNVIIPYIDSFFSVFTEKLGLAEMVTERNSEGTKRYPGIPVGLGQIKQIDLDHIISYHRLRGAKSIDYTDNNASGCSKGIRITYPMYMIGMVKNDCQYSNDTLSNLVANELIGIDFPKSIRATIKAWSAEIEVVEINQSAESVFEQEYTNIDLNIDMAYCYFSISYNIIIEADSSCLDSICPPNITPEETFYITSLIGEILTTPEGDRLTYQ